MLNLVVRIVTPVFRAFLKDDVNESMSKHDNHNKLYLKPRLMRPVAGPSGRAV